MRKFIQCQVSTSACVPASGDDAELPPPLVPLTVGWKIVLLMVGGHSRYSQRVGRRLSWGLRPKKQVLVRAVVRVTHLRPSKRRLLATCSACSSRPQRCCALGSSRCWCARPSWQPWLRTALTGSQSRFGTARPTQRSGTGGSKSRSGQARTAVQTQSAQSVT
jgi:hypothetical protein